MKKGTVTASLDQKIYDLIHKLLDQQTEENKRVNSDKESFETIALARDLNMTDIIHYVQLKDFQLRRMKKNNLEKLVDDVLKIVREDEQEELSDIIDKRDQQVDSDFENLDESNMMVVKETNSFNKSLISSWSKASTTNDTVKVQADTTKTGQAVEANGTETSKNPSETTEEEDKKRKRKEVTTRTNKKKKIDHTPPSIKLSQLGGMESITTQLMELIGLPILHPEIYLSTGVEPPRGVLLYGPPGCGKTTIANALAGELQVPFISISAPSIVSGMSGESEKKLREIFEDAKNNAPCLIFMDEIDSITPKRDGGAQREMERRIVAQLLTLMDELTLDKTDGKPVIVMGATNRPDSLDSALRRAGRFDREICLNVPNEDQRVSILQAMTANLKLTSEDFQFKKLAKLTPGFVGADLKSLVTASGVFAIKRIFESLSEQQELEELMGNNSVDSVGGRIEEIGQNGDGQSGQHSEQIIEIDDSMDIDLKEPKKPEEPKDPKEPILDTSNLIEKFKNKTDDEKLSIIQKFLIKHPTPLTEAQLEPLSINFQDFLDALPTIQPTAKREGFATIPDVSWDNVGALNKIRMELHMCIVQPIKKPEIFERVGITAPAGVLMWGPPGCGKTLLAKAVANESRANFISIKGPELLNKYVGESERAIRQVFQRARASVPCIIFFDELDALVPKRDNSLSESSSRVVNTLLTELDGLNDRKGVFVIGATNRPDIIDPAMIRPGRLDKSLYIELPSQEERLDILQTLIKSNGTPVDTSVDLHQIVGHPKCRNFSGADLSSLVREAGVIALKKRFFNSKVDVLDKSEFVNEDDDIGDEIFVGMDDFVTALSNIKPSVSDKDRLKYDKLNKRMGPVVEEAVTNVNE